MSSKTEAGGIAGALGGRKIGRGWMARCPAHDDRKPSLSIRDENGKVLFHCHAGCRQEQVIAALRARGLWQRVPYSHVAVVAPVALANDPSSRISSALAIWRGGSPAGGTLVETYLASRGLQVPSRPVLRFHPWLMHTPTNRSWPAMVALVTRSEREEPREIHRTWLARDGGGKAPVPQAKMTLGPCRGGVVKLAEPDEVLVLAEGIETALSAGILSGYPAWSALSASNLPNVVPPAHVRVIILAADHDDSGAGRRFAALATDRFHAMGFEVHLALPPEGQDFNDVLREHAV